MILGPESCKSTATLPLLHHIIPRLVQPSNQSTCFHRKTSATTTSCPFWLDRPDSFFTFTSTACAFRKQRINVTIPFTTLSNYLTPFWTNFSTSFNNLFGRNINITFYFYVPRSFRNCINRQGIITASQHHTPHFYQCECFGLIGFTMNTSGWEHRIIIGERESKPRIPQEQMGIMSTDHSVLTGMENEIPCLLLLQSINAIRNEHYHITVSSISCEICLGPFPLPWFEKY